MPIFRANGKVVYFAHIPKCGGTAIEESIASSDVELFFLDRCFLETRDRRWYKSSPQHITLEDLTPLFSEGFFDYQFAVVREPTQRFLSAFNYNRLRIGRLVSLDRFLDRMEKRVASCGDYFGHRYDNHFVPASRFVPAKARIFYLEDGIDSILSEVEKDLALSFKVSDQKNKREYAFTESPSKFKETIKKVVMSDSPKFENLTKDQKERLQNLYKEDYDRFYPSSKHANMA